MSFKDLLDKYKNGTASEEEITLVQEELQKYEVISEYLSQGYDIYFENHSLSLTDNTDTTSVKKTVNKKLRKTILSSVIIVFSILLTTNYIISPLVSSFYYNPSQKSVAKYHDNLYFDLKVITELNLPGYAINTVRSQNLGFGKYDIYFERVNLFNREAKSTNTTIKRSYKNGDSYHDFFPINFMEFLDIAPDDRNKNSVEERRNERNEELINYIKELNPKSYVCSYVILQEDITTKDFDELRKKYNDKVTFRWAAVRTAPYGTPNEYLSGFNPNLNDGSVTGESMKNDKYPYLQLVDYMRDGIDSGTFNGSFDEAYTKHFISLLRYANDRKKAVAALDNNEIKSDYYKSSLNYVESNGVNIYGLLINGEAEELLQFLANEKIKTIDIKGVLASKYVN